MSSRSADLIGDADADELLQEMRELPTTSARIRALHARGMGRREIVDYLNEKFQEPGRRHPFRYQHVRNVLVQHGPSEGEGNAATDRAVQVESKFPERLDVQVGPAGRIVIPAPFRSAMEVGEGDRLMARVVDGELRLISPRMAVARAQKRVRELIPGDASLVDVLITERQKEVEEEFGNG